METGFVPLRRGGSHLRRRYSRPMTRRPGATPDQWQVFLAFWIVAGLTLLTIGVVMFAVARHAHRIGAAIALLGIACLAVANVLRLGRRASR